VTIYKFTNKGWLDESTGKLSTGGPAPAASVELLFPAGSFANVVLSPGGAYIAGTGPAQAYGSIVINANATVNFGTFSSFDTSSYDFFSVRNMTVGKSAHVSFNGNIEGFPATESVYVGSLTLQSGSVFNLGGVPEEASSVGPDHIGTLINQSGATFIPPSGTAIAANPTATSLEIGGNGFVQTGGFLGGESETNNGHGLTTLNLGTVAHNSLALDVISIISNAAVGGSFHVSSPDGAFSGFMSPTTGGVDIGLNTAALGAHTATFSYTNGAVHDVLTVMDRVV
jgi:hypothetical protein